MPYAPGASERFHRNNSPASEGTGSSALTGRAVILMSLTPYREKRFSAQVRACSFPSWPEAPTGWGAKAPGPCDCPTVFRTGPEWADRRNSWGSWRPLPVTGQGCPLRPSWRHGETGRARRGGPCTAMPNPWTQTVGTVCVAEGSKHESKHSSDQSLQTNPGAGCIWSCTCVSASWAGDARFKTRRSRIGRRLPPSLGTMKCSKTPASSRLEGPAGLHILPGGQQSPRARQERSGLPPKCQGRFIASLDDIGASWNTGGATLPWEAWRVILRTGAQMHRCTATALSTWGMSTSPVAAAPSRVAVMGRQTSLFWPKRVRPRLHQLFVHFREERKLGRAWLRGANHLVARSWEREVCTPPVRCLRRHWESMAICSGSDSAVTPKWGSPAKSSFSEDDCPAAVAAIKYLILYRRAEWNAGHAVNDTAGIASLNRCEPTVICSFRKSALLVEVPREIATDRVAAVRTVTPTRTASRQILNGFVEINTFIHSALK